MESAIKRIANLIAEGGMFVASIRTDDALLADKPPYSLPYLHKTEKGRRIPFQSASLRANTERSAERLKKGENCAKIVPVATKK